MNLHAVSRTGGRQLCGGTITLLEEALARSRMREAERTARQYRQARRLVAGRNWQRLASWTARRAANARAAL